MNSQKFGANGPNSTKYIAHDMFLFVGGHLLVLALNIHFGATATEGEIWYGLDSHGMICQDFQMTHVFS